jgi:hypothetical protein
MSAKKPKRKPPRFFCSPEPREANVLAVFDADLSVQPRERMQTIREFVRALEAAARMALRRPPDAGDDPLAALDAAMADWPFGARTIVHYAALLRDPLRGFWR